MHPAGGGVGVRFLTEKKRNLSRQRLGFRRR